MKTRIAMSAALIAMFATVSFGDTVVFNGGNLALAANWGTGSKPVSGDTGLIEVDGTLSIGNTIGGWIGSGVNLVIQGGATVTSGGGLPLLGTNGSGDYGHNAGGVTSTFNDATLLVDDDIFANNALMTFNDGSVAMTGDDFEANSGGIITINGGTHTAGDFFGAQAGCTVNVLGGTLSAATFRINGTASMNLGGDAVLSGGAGGNVLTLLEGAIDVASDWSGSWTIVDADWEAEVTGGGWTVDGSAIDASNFASNFEVDGTTLTAIPEPATLGLVAVFGGGVLFIRRRFMI